MEEDETEEEILEKLSAELPVTGYPPQPSHAKAARFGLNLCEM